MSRWIRWYEGTSEDGKFRAVARMSGVTIRDVIALWAAMLEDAGHLTHRGVCQRSPAFMASVLDFDDDAVPRILGAMQDIGMVSGDDGGIRICSWKKRQFESDTDPTAARRQRDKRQRERLGHASVTGDTGGSDTETETDTEAKTKKERKSRAVAHATFEDFWKCFPKRAGSNPKVPAIKAFNKAIDGGHDPQSVIAGARGYSDECDREKTERKYVVQAVTWINQSRWVDYPALPDFTGPQKVFVDQNTPAGKAWTDYEIATMGKRGPRHNDGWWYETEYPPGHEAAQ